MFLEKGGEMMITNANGYLDGNGKSPFGAHSDHTHETVKLGNIPYVEPDLGDPTTALQDLCYAFNTLLNEMKQSGMMERDPIIIGFDKELYDEDPNHANRQHNTEQVAGITMKKEGNEHVITITLNCEVSELEDFDGGNGWGVHKWLGIGIVTQVEDITKIKYNGEFLTEADVEEAVSVALDSKYDFVRWVAADLVLNGDNTQKSKDTFTLSVPEFNFGEETYKLKIEEGGYTYGLMRS